MPQSFSLNSPTRYEVRIQGRLDDSWLGWFGGAKIHTEVLADNSEVTTFSDLIMDQAALVGLIRRLHGFGIVLVSIAVRAPDDPAASQDARGAEATNQEIR